MGSGLERRGFQRLEIPLTVDVEIIPGNGVPRGAVRLQAKCRNISQGGICLEAGRIELDCVHLLCGAPGARVNRLRLEVGLIPEELRFEATGQLCWYDFAAPGAPEAAYLLGVEFVEFRGDGRDRLLRFLQMHREKGRLLPRLFR